jgi:hypothetical protein
MTRSQKIIIGILVGFIISIGLAISIIKAPNGMTEERVSNYKYNGVVIKMYRNPNNHNSLTIKLSDNKNVPTFTPEIYHQIQLGDSLYKTKKSFYMNVFRNDSLLFKFNHLEAERNYKR